jgi:hypothetical protein
VSKFKVGDHVERVGTLVPEFMRSGTVIRVVPNEVLGDLFAKYEVNFGDRMIATFYEPQLQLAQPIDSH